MRSVASILLLLLTGCAVPTEPSPRVESGVVVERTVDVAPDSILIRFKTLDCVCHLGNVEFALLQLPGVASIDWDVEHHTALMIFIDDRRPTDDSIRAAIADFGVEISSIQRPLPTP